MLMVNYGSGTTRVNNTVINVSDGKPHLIEIVFTKTTIELFVDDCHYTSCMALIAPTGRNEQLNGKFCLIKSQLKSYEASDIGIRYMRTHWRI